MTRFPPYVLVMFMPGAPTTTEPSNTGPNPDRQAAGGAPTPSGRLAGLLHKLIDFGKNLLDTLRGQPSADTLLDASIRFGTRDIAVIVGRIIRGLRLAAELEERVVRAGPRLDHPPARAVAARIPPDQPPPAPPAETGDPAPLRLPTAREIAARARNQPIGAVIVEICNDLGILAADRLWRDIVDAVNSHGGSFTRLVRDMFRRTALTNRFPPDTPLLLPMPDSWMASTSGPPPILGARPP